MQIIGLQKLTQRWVEGIYNAFHRTKFLQKQIEGCTVRTPERTFGKFTSQRPTFLTAEPSFEGRTLRARSQLSKSLIGALDLAYPRTRLPYKQIEGCTVRTAQRTL